MFLSNGTRRGVDGFMLFDATSLAVVHGLQVTVSKTAYYEISTSHLASISYNFLICAI